MNSKLFLALVGAASLASTPLTTYSQIPFSDDFDVDHTANWTVNKSTGANANDAGSSAEFFFDYSTVGIPSAPNSLGGTTRGLRLRANMTGGIFSGLSVSPTGQSFIGDFTLRFDMWMNYNGPVGTGDGNVAGGNGTTQAGGVGIGTAGTTAQWAGGAHDSLHFSATVDGGSATDYRVYPVASIAAPSSGYYAAGTATTPTDARNDTHPYYQGLGEKTAPGAQVTLFPGQTGTTRLGAPGFAWRDIVVQKTGSIVTWRLDGLLIATVDSSSLTFGGSNILFDYYDTNATSSTDPNAPSLLFMLIDNVNVVPEPSTATLLLLGGAGVVSFLRRRK